MKDRPDRAARLQLIESMFAGQSWQTQYLMEAEKAARSLEDMPSPVLARLLQLLGRVALRQGEYLTDLMNLGLVATEQGHYEQAETYLQEGLALTRRLGHVQLLCSMLYECTNTIPVLQVDVN